MASIIFILNKEKTIINCSGEEYIEDLCKEFSRKINSKNDEIIYLYKGRKINPKITFNDYIKKEDIKKKQMNVLCFKVIKMKNNLNPKNIVLEGKNIYEEGLNQNFKLKTKEILCPKCGEICKIKIEDFKITLYECKNGHKIENIDFEQFIESKKNAKCKIICDICKDSQKAANFGNIFLNV